MPKLENYNLKTLPTLWPTDFCCSQIFSKKAPLDLEIGAGRPHFFFDRIANFPERNIVAIEWKHEFVAQAERRIVRENIQNGRAFHGNAWLLVPLLFGPRVISEVFVNFPDPWWKARHKKRLVLNDIFLNTLHTRMAPDSFILLQTDVKDLFDFYRSLIHEHSLFTYDDSLSQEQIRSRAEAQSHREKKCLEQELAIYRGIFRPK